MFAMFLLTTAVLLVMFKSRVRAVRSKDVPLSYFKNYGESPLPDYVVWPARHFSNLFEAPVLFYVACLAAMILDVTGYLIVGLAWGYVVSRVFHALVHIQKNNVFTRMRIYFVSWLFLAALWISIVVAVS